MQRPGTEEPNSINLLYCKTFLTRSNVRVTTCETELSVLFSNENDTETVIIMLACRRMRSDDNLVTVCLYHGMV